MLHLFKSSGKRGTASSSLAQWIGVCHKVFKSILFSKLVCVCISEWNRFVCQHPYPDNAQAEAKAMPSHLSGFPIDSRIPVHDLLQWDLFSPWLNTGKYFSKHLNCRHSICIIYLYTCAKFLQISSVLGGKGTLIFNDPNLLCSVHVLICTRPFNH